MLRLISSKLQVLLTYLHLSKSINIKLRFFYDCQSHVSQSDLSSKNHHFCTIRLGKFDRFHVSSYHGPIHSSHKNFCLWVLIETFYPYCLHQPILNIQYFLMKFLLLCPQKLTYLLHVTQVYYFWDSDWLIFD
jgi:hypothetical protein